MGSSDLVEKPAQLAPEDRREFKDLRDLKVYEGRRAQPAHKESKAQKEIRVTPELKVQKEQRERRALRVLKEILEPQGLEDRRGLPM